MIFNDIEFTSIPGIDDYMVSRCGQVLSLKKKPFIVLKPHRNKLGYIRVSICDGQNAKTRTVHSLVALAFLGPTPDGYEIAHNDGNSSNNIIDNLRFATFAENQADRMSHGTDNRGARNPLAKLDDVKAKEARRLFDNGMRKTDIARKFGVTRSAIYYVIKCRTWTHVARESGFN